LPDSRETQRCEICGGINTPESSASITQWIQRRSCNQRALDDSAQELTICSRCGKRKEGGRAGSFTQWVFRADFCKCGVEAALTPGSRPRASAQNYKDTGTDSQDLEQNPELTIDPASFPVARYVARAIMGGGAGGTVYLCFDKVLNKRVAIKVLNSLSPEKIISFQNEARATSSLTHSNIIKVLDFGVTTGGTPYMVMEHLGGMSLDKLLKEQRLEIADTIEVFKQVCDALSHAHKQKLFHRDVKCSNILIAAPDSRDQNVKLIDFGVASFKPDEFSTIIQGVTLVGTPQYMSPDQAQAKPYDARSEVYSLGCSMFEALTGSPPFEGQSALDLISKHAHEPAPALSDIDPETDFSPELERVVARCLQKAPEDRYQSMSDLKADLIRLTPMPGNYAERESLTGREDYTLISESTFFKSAAKKRLSFLIPLAVAALIGALIWIYVLVSSITSPEVAQTVIHDADIELSLPSLKVAEAAKIKKTKFKTLRTGKDIWLIPTGSIQDSDLAELENRNDFQLLSLKRQSLSGIGLKHLIGCKNMTGISFEGTELSPNGVDALVKLKNLEDVNLTSSDLSNDCFKRLTKLPKLRQLSLDDTEVDDSTIDHLCSTLKNLEYVSLSHSTNIKGSCLDSLAKQKHLRVLFCNATSIKGANLQALKNFPKLKVLALRKLQLSDRDLEPLTQVKTLTHMDLSDNNLTDQSVNTLEKMNWLTSVTIGDCLLSKEGVARLRKKLPATKVADRT